MDFGHSITHFKDDYEFLSNDAQVDIIYNKKQYNSVQLALDAAMQDPGIASRPDPVRNGVLEMKLDGFLDQKFGKEYYKQMLINTQGYHLLNGYDECYKCPCDMVLGVCYFKERKWKLFSKPTWVTTVKGENILGEKLMVIRNRLIEAASRQHQRGGPKRRASTM